MARSVPTKGERSRQSAFVLAITFFVAAFALVFAIDALVVRRCLWGSPLFVGATTFCVATARTPEAWGRGLSGRPSLGARYGMLFLFPSVAEQTFWMKDMRFPLDMIWIRGGRVVGWEADVVVDGGARRVLTPPIDQVLEVNAGEARVHGINIGDIVRYGN